MIQYCSLILKITLRFHIKKIKIKFDKTENRFSAIIRVNKSVSSLESQNRLILAQRKQLPAYGRK
jgi:hypothetical protein